MMGLFYLLKRPPLAAALIFFAALTATPSAFCGEEDILLADFEGEDYGDWEVAGEAFGTGPARGTLPNQMVVSRFLGGGLVNTYLGGDGTTGSLVSPPFKIERKYINFLIGGGADPEKLAIRLLLEDDGGEVRQATGPNTRPGGTEALSWHSWDVAEFLGRTARIVIIDEATGPWGHINVDHITQSNERHDMIKDFTRDVTIAAGYLHFPVSDAAPKRLVRVRLDGELVREFEICLALGQPDYWVYLGTSEWKGKALVVTAEQFPGDPTDLLAQLSTGDLPKDFDTFYRESGRPQFHFTPPRGWNNDPNGMLFYKGEYHLFYQHNPYGTGWGNMSWGHAVSEDMLHWTHLPVALHPDELGTIFSGTAVVDHNNSSGFKNGEENPIVCFYTSAGATGKWSENRGCTQSVAYSNDRGRTWTKHEGNPIVGEIRGGNRDPKVFWHEESGQWCMVLYIEEEEMAFLTSDNLLDWTEISRLKSFHECPELFKLPVDGDENNSKWVLYGASGSYFLGDFDGKVFTPETDAIQYHHGNAFYASQTFNCMPAEDGRRIQMAWGQIGTPGMPFTQMMTFPVELSLKTTPAGVRMCPMPIREIDKLHAREERFDDTVLAEGVNPLADTQGDLLDIEAEIVLGTATSVGFAIRGAEIAYDAGSGELHCGELRAPLTAPAGRVQLRVLVDTTSVEVFANGGEVYMPLGAYPQEPMPANPTLFAMGGVAHITTLSVRELRSVWAERDFWEMPGEDR